MLLSRNQHNIVKKAITFQLKENKILKIRLILLHRIVVVEIKCNKICRMLSAVLSM